MTDRIRAVEALWLAWIAALAAAAPVRHTQGTNTEETTT